MKEYRTQRGDGRTFAMTIGDPTDPVRVWEEIGPHCFPCTVFSVSTDGGPGRFNWAAERLREWRLSGHFLAHASKVWGWRYGA